jgi:hypothetical protein
VDEAPFPWHLLHHDPQDGGQIDLKVSILIDNDRRRCRRFYSVFGERYIYLSLYI